MNAPQPSRISSLQNADFNQPNLRPRRLTHRHHQSHGAIVTETVVKLIISAALSVTAVSALLRILPYHLSQQNRVQEIQLEVELTEARVSQLRSEFNRYFDPQQAKALMQEQSQRIDPNQRRIIWLDRAATKPKVR